jgi:hypothetical protein
MRLFGFFNKKDNDKSKEIKLTSNDFKLVSETFEVLGTKTSDDFNELFKDYIVDAPKKAGDTINLISRTTNVEMFGKTVEIIFYENDAESLEKAIERINGKLNWIRANRNQLDFKINEQVSDLKNETMENLSEFYSLKSVAFMDYSTTELAYDFEEKDIVVGLNNDNEITKINV